MKTAYIHKHSRPLVQQRQTSYYILNRLYSDISQTCISGATALALRKYAVSQQRRADLRINVCIRTILASRNVCRKDLQSEI